MKYFKLALLPLLALVLAGAGCQTFAGINLGNNSASTSANANVSASADSAGIDADITATNTADFGSTTMANLQP